MTLTETAATKAGKDLTTTPLYSEDQLADIKSFDDAMALLSDAGIEVTDISDYGDGFSVVEKRTLVNVPFIVLDWKFAQGKYDSDFCVVRLVTSDGRKCLITDGSTGLREQVRNIESKGKSGGVMVKNGLTVSEYTYIEDGKEKPAETFYLSM